MRKIQENTEELDGSEEKKVRIINKEIRKENMK